ncbi:hypothetical protein N7510_006256 [Penicillium lagena]|uniref:uncharacterized protein n=1 Tax=Penicillium lagena TaxID=94218 RepID=UPI00254159EF|nr:uncharacterized protein N7510_006256 [Penicillium lagena]KAJ5613062.1 hypothetical protein N7510_006256 [Penicillium lagena]
MALISTSPFTPQSGEEDESAAESDMPQSAMTRENVPSSTKTDDGLKIRYGAGRTHYRLARLQDNSFTSIGAGDRSEYIENTPERFSDRQHLGDAPGQAPSAKIMIIVCDRLLFPFRESRLTDSTHE